MTTATITWPATLPQNPQHEGYSEGYEDNVIRSAPDKGPSKTRPRFTRLRKTKSLSFMLTDAQKATFDTFFESIKGGALPYNWADPISGAPIVVLVRDKLEGPSRIAKNAWKISFSVEVLP